jgi:hypothetical protein
LEHAVNTTSIFGLERAVKKATALFNRFDGEGDETARRIAEAEKLHDTALQEQ